VPYIRKRNSSLEVFIQDIIEMPTVHFSPKPKSVFHFSPKPKSVFHSPLNLNQCLLDFLNDELGHVRDMATCFVSL
jgi:hypothetical protein